MAVEVGRRYARSRHFSPEVVSAFVERAISGKFAANLGRFARSSFGLCRR
jgi:hypothetical protein